MSVRQISVFVENSPGRVSRLTELLEQAGVSIRGFQLADTVDFGIARFIVDKPEAAELALRGAGVLTKSAALLCIELPDTPGALDQVFRAVAAANINVEYGYSLVSTYVVFKVDDIERAESLLADQPIRFIEQDELEGSLRDRCE